MSTWATAGAFLGGWVGFRLGQRAGAARTEREYVWMLEHGGGIPNRIEGTG